MTNPSRLQMEAEKNLAWLTKNPYPGRGIVAGLDQDGRYLVQIYWIMGRSENSRNRVFSVDGGRVRTEPVDQAKAGGLSLIIYNAMREHGGYYVVSNGRQSDTSIDRGPWALGNALESHEYEPDAPNFTQRITSVFATKPDDTLLQISVLRKSLFGPRCDRLLYCYDSLAPGLGYCVTTYSGDGDPLPAFRGEPLLMPIEGGVEDIAAAYWNALNPDNRVSLAVKFIHMVSGKSTIRVANKYSKVT